MNAMQTYIVNGIGNLAVRADVAWAGEGPYAITLATMKVRFEPDEQMEALAVDLSRSQAVQLHDALTEFLESN